MLALQFLEKGYAFVYHQGSAIGAVQIGKVKGGMPRPKVQLLFSGNTHDFEVLRPNVILRRFGQPELERLIRKFFA